ncbi:MAG: hypothetical protein HQ471_07740 [Flavobacteriales bacterium]|nr:hypothetical protein [Flavobacteriales bacterium]
MKAKLILPEHLGEITLGQFQRYTELIKRKDLSEHQFNKRKVEIFTNLKYRDIKGVRDIDLKDILNQIDNALGLTVEFQNRFTLDGIEYGFIPNFDEITGGEFVAIKDYEPKHENDVEKMHSLMSILFRPVVSEDVFKNYNIKSFDAKDLDNSETFKRMPLSVVNGALGFFLNLESELLTLIQRYTEEERAKEVKHQSILKSGGGMQLSQN